MINFTKSNRFVMDLQGDINWIKNELNHVTNPHLIEAIKQLLAYRKANSPMTKAELWNQIEEAEAQIKKGDFLSIEDFEKKSKQWD